MISQKSPLCVTRLQCEHIENPLGVQIPMPLLSWEALSGRTGASTTAVQILAASSPELLADGIADLWDSGKKATAENQADYRNGLARSGQRVFWKVRVWDEADQPSPWSDPAWFEFGILNSEEWAGEWIGTGDRECAPYLRREFEVKPGLCRARAYFSGLGYGELYLNGMRVGDGYFTPAWTDYDKREYRDLYYPYEDRTRKRVLYTVSDVTGLIRSGRNAVGCILGNGMHNQQTRINEGKMSYGSVRMLLNLVLEYEDGSLERVVSDPQWRWNGGAIRFDQLFVGERYDARCAIPKNWALPDFDETGWQTVTSAPCPVGKLHAQICPADRVIASLPPVKQSEPLPGVFVLDFGRVISGWVKITVCGEVGQRVVMRFSEELKPKGTLDFRSAGATSKRATGEPQIQTDEYILSGSGVETYSPRFVWHAFRYAEVTGWPGGAPKEGEILAQVVHVDLASTMEFSCSEPLFQRIHESFRATLLANLHSGVLSDCPHRERLGYTGDGQITCEAAMWNFQSAAFYAKWIDDIFDAQNQETGFIPHTVPYYGGGGGYGWGAAGVIIPWTYAKFYGDTRVLRENYAGMVRWMDYIERHCDECGVVTHEEPGSWCLGDWAFPEQVFDIAKVPVSPELVNTFYYGYCAQLMSEIAARLGNDEDTRKFAAKLERIREDFHRAFYNPVSGGYRDGRGGANAFALVLGAVPPEAIQRAVADMLAHSDAFDTGIFGTPILLEALTKHRAADRAWALMAGSAFPSFGFMLANGATTLWESWQKEQGSHCHPMFGSVCAWFYKTVVGLEQETDSWGFDRVVWRPGMVGKFARLDYLSPKGEIALEWSASVSDIDACATIPPGIAMKVVSPFDGSIIELGSGTHALKLRKN